MRKNYFLPQTEIIPHITLECIQSTQISVEKQVGDGNESETNI